MLSNPHPRTPPPSSVVAHQQRLRLLHHAPNARRPRHRRPRLHGAVEGRRREAQRQQSGNGVQVERQQHEYTADRMPEAVTSPTQVLARV